MPTILKASLPSHIKEGLDLDVFVGQFFYVLCFFFFFFFLEASKRL